MAPRGSSRRDAGDSRFDRLGASQRVAYGAAFRSIGELASKPATLVFYIVLARNLSRADFGVFVFAISLSTVLLTLAGLGLQELVAREVSRDRSRVDVLFWNAFALRASLIAALLVVTAGLALLGGYSADSWLAILIISVGVGLEDLTSILAAVFQAFERQQHTATALLINRLVTAALGIGALLLGGGLVVVAILTTFGSGLGLLIAYLLMQRRVVRPQLMLDRRRWGGLLRRGFPIGVLNVLGETVLRSSVALFGLLAASEVEVGEYGAAFRLIEATLFITWSYSNAVMPWFSRHPGDDEGTTGLARGFELSLKGVLSVTLPLALAFALFADPLIDALFGSRYAGAVVPLQLLAGMTVLWGVNGVISAVLVGRNRTRDYVRPALTAIVLTAILAPLLMPSHGATGAALTTLPAAFILALGTITTTVGIVGPISPLRILATPVLAGAALTGVTVLLAGLPWLVTAALAVTTYGLVFLLAERAWCPEDYAYYVRIIGFRRQAKAAT